MSKYPYFFHHIEKMALPISVVISVNADNFIATTPLLFTLRVSLNPSATTSTVSVTPQSAGPSGTPIMLNSTQEVQPGGVTIFYATLVAGSIPGVISPVPVAFSFVVNNGTFSTLVTVSSIYNPGTVVVSKTANTSTYNNTTLITYNYLVQNDGSSPAMIVSVLDSKAGAATVNGAATAPLPAGGSIVFKASYAATTDDVTAGSITNVVTVTSVMDAVESAVTASLVLYPYPDFAIPFVPAFIGLSISKSANVTSFNTFNENIIYTYVVTNNGFGTPGASQLVTVTDLNPAVTITTPPQIIATGMSVTFTGTYVTTMADVTNGYVSNLGQAVGNPGATSFFTIAYSGLVINAGPLVCIHSSSLVWHINDSRKEQREISAIKNGDMVLAADGKPAWVKRVMMCRDRHPDSKTPHTCIVFPPNSLAPGVPDKLFIVDPGHPIATPEHFNTIGVVGLMPAKWYIDRDVPTTAYKSDWYAIKELVDGLPLRYDLVLEDGSCGAYLANGVVVKARISAKPAGYWHDADE